MKKVLLCVVGGLLGFTCTIVVADEKLDHADVPNRNIETQIDKISEEEIRGYQQLTIDQLQSSIAADEAKLTVKRVVLSKQLLSEAQDSNASPVQIKQEAKLGTASQNLIMVKCSKCNKYTSHHEEVVRKGPFKQEVHYWVCDVCRTYIRQTLHNE